MIDIEKIVKDLLAELDKPGDKSPSPVERPAAPALSCMETLAPWDVAKRLEHSLLVADLTRETLLTQCRMARDLQIAAICVAPNYVSDAVEILAGSGVAVSTAVGFPSALLSTEAKIADIRACVMDGAAEIDLAIDIAAVKSGNMAKAEKDFTRAVEAAGGRAIIKAVFEHGSFDSDEQKQVLEMIGRSGVPFLKIQNLTSGHGARREEIALVQSVLGDKIKIKIDGGVKTLEQAMALFRAGAERIGLTATKAIVDEAEKRK